MHVEQVRVSRHNCQGIVCINIMGNQLKESQYIPRILHIFHVLFCFILLRYNSVLPIFFSLLHRHLSNRVVTGWLNCRSFCVVPECIAIFTFAVFVIISGDCNYPEHYLYILEFVPAAYNNKTIWLCAMSLRSVSVPYITYFKTKTLLLWRVLLTGFWLVEAEWRIYASLNWVIIGSDNGL